MSMTDHLIEIHEDDEPYTGEVDGMMLARTLLIEHARLARKVDLLDGTVNAIIQQYGNRIVAAKQRQDEIRQQLKLYLERGGVVNFPDAGSAYLRSVKDKARITDPVEFQAWAKEQGEVFERSHFDRMAAQHFATEFVLQAGEVPPGVEFEPAGLAVTIRGAEVEAVTPDE